MVPKSLWNELKKWIKKASKNFDKLSLLGTGGNINKIHKITATNDGMPISLEVLELLYKKMSSLSYDQRIVEYQMNPDRADVILPAFKIYLKAMRWSKISKIFVPKKKLRHVSIRDFKKQKFCFCSRLYGKSCSVQQK